VWEGIRMFDFLVSSKWWEGRDFINSTAFVICWMVAIAEYTCNVVGFVF
jgi:hypothetical protein